MSQKQETETPDGYVFFGKANTPTQSMALRAVEDYAGCDDFIAIRVKDSFNTYTQTWEWDVYRPA